MSDEVDADGEVAVATRAPPGGSEAEKVSSLITNTMLSSMVTLLEETKLQLTMQVQDLKEQLAQQKEDQNDIYFYLNKKCDDSYEVIASLEEQLLSEQADREVAEKLYERRIEDISTRATNEENRFKLQISELEEKMLGLNEFSGRKAEYEKTIQSLSETLDNERLEHFKLVEEMENKFVIEKDRLRRDFERRCQEISKELDSTVEDKLSDKTRKTKLVNSLIKNELRFQSKQADKVLEINQQIVDKERELRIELQLAQSSEKEMMNRLSMYQRMVKQLNESLVKEEQAKEALRADFSESLQFKEEQITALRLQLLQSEQKYKMESARLDEMWSFLSNAYEDAKVSAEKATEPTFSTHVSSPGKVTTKGIDHEQILIEVLRFVVQKYPQKFVDLYPPAAKQGLGVGGGSQSTNGGSVSFFPSLLSSSSSHQSKPPGGELSSTGIPSWDGGKSLGGTSKKDKLKGSMCSVGVQTEGRIAPFAHGSVFLQDKYRSPTNDGYSLILSGGSPASRFAVELNDGAETVPGGSLLESSSSITSADGLIAETQSLNAAFPPKIGSSSKAKVKRVPYPVHKVQEVHHAGGDKSSNSTHVSSYSSEGGDKGRTGRISEVAKNFRSVRESKFAGSLSAYRLGGSSLQKPVSSSSSAQSQSEQHANFVSRFSNHSNNSPQSSVSISPRLQPQVDTDDLTVTPRLIDDETNFD